MCADWKHHWLFRHGIEYIDEEYARNVLIPHYDKTSGLDINYLAKQLPKPSFWKRLLRVLGLYKTNEEQEWKQIEEQMAKEALGGRYDYETKGSGSKLKHLGAKEEVLEE